MKKTIIEEFLWLIGCVIVSILLFASKQASLDIHLHDTYSLGIFLGPHFTAGLFIFYYFIMLGFCTYLMRVLYFEFKIIPADVVFLIFTGLVLYFLTDILFLLHPSRFKIPQTLETTTTASITRYYDYTDIWLAP